MTKLGWLQVSALVQLALKLALEVMSVAPEFGLPAALVYVTLPRASRVYWT